MTCIVGVVDNEKGEVYIGADSAGSANGTNTHILSPKVFKKGEVIMGYTSSFRIGQVLQYDFKIPKMPEYIEDEHEYMVRTFVPELRKVLKEGGCAEVNNEKESGGHFLVGINGRLFHVQGDYSVLENLHPYSAIGSGGDYAYGSLHTSSSIYGDSMLPEKMIEIALESASLFCTTVLPPFHILKGGAD